MRYQIARKTRKEFFVWAWIDDLGTCIRTAEAVNVPESELIIGDCETGRNMTIRQAREVVCNRNGYLNPSCCKSTPDETKKGR